jgi:glycosyltransferase involved in cell wall biosynthesis
LRGELQRQKHTHRDMLDVSVVIPAYDEGPVIGPVVQRICQRLTKMGLRYEVLVINDGSRDQTAQAAAEAGAHVVSHPYNIGNGAAVKTGIRRAGGKTILFMDGDGQHSPDDIPAILGRLATYDMVVGARNADTESSLHRDLANTVYNGLASYICGRHIDDLTSGFRGIRAHVGREFVGLLPNTFSYPTTLTLAVVRAGYSLDYVPIKVFRRTGKSKIRLLKDGLRFLILLFKIATLYSPLKIFLPASFGVFLIGILYGAYKVAALGEPYGPTSGLLVAMAGLIFLMGLISEQITQLRYERGTGLEDS